MTRGELQHISNSCELPSAMGPIDEILRRACDLSATTLSSSIINDHNRIHQSAGPAKTKKEATTRKLTRSFPRAGLFSRNYK